MAVSFFKLEKLLLWKNPIELSGQPNKNRVAI